MASENVKIQVLKMRFANDLYDKTVISQQIGGMPAAMRRKVKDTVEKAFDVAIEFMNSKTFHEGFLRMLRLKRADLTLEYLVVEYGTSLFPEETVAKAKWRLAEGQKKIVEASSE